MQLRIGSRPRPPSPLASALLRRKRLREGELDSSCFYLYNFAVVTAFAVHDFGPLGGIGSFKLVRTVSIAVEVGGGIFVYSVFGSNAHAGTMAVPKFCRITHPKPRIITAVRTECGNRHIKLPVKFEFRGNNPKRCCAFFSTCSFVRTPDNFFQN